ncbi:hypothetical protein AM500_03175 [Bacillus sp. FJAT-18017]|uniref:hypothetical protein n=1 Tax=Bacillus sp. FJAT-18017 TaxID=1705566 RepID=UPI0006ADB263|nr:hypothetical protein [Bacillus sp. FJAT-18017]ALC88911.1 hypothetical protein AM500_03175 [Bacillus sp. FJAT-18017]
MEIGQKKIFNKAFVEKGMKDVVLWDVLKIKDEELIRVKFISKRSPHRQGLWLRTDKGIVIPELSEEVFPSVTLWEDTAQQEVICKCFSTDGNLSLYNIWDKGNGSKSQGYTSGMLIEEHDNGILVYKCNDYGFETDFTDLVFSVEKL